MNSLLDIVVLMFFGAFMIFIASNKIARTTVSNASLLGMLAKTQRQKERVEARTKIGFLITGVITVVVALVLLTGPFVEMKVNSWFAHGEHSQPIVVLIRHYR